MMHRHFLVAAAVACIGHGEPTLAQQWQELGPEGGGIHAIAVAPTGVGPMYALAGRRVFASADEGASWIELATPPGCAAATNFSGLQVRSDGDVFANCNVRNMHSRDGAHSWSLVGASGANIVDGALVFDPRNPQHAVVLRWFNYVQGVVFTADDGLTFSAPVLQYGVAVPTLVAWDPVEAERLVAVGAEGSPAPHPEFEIGYFESRDHGAHWSWVAGIVRKQPVNGCGERELLVDAAGRLYVTTGCGIFRSLDGGRTWEAAGGIAGTELSRLAVDPANSGRLLSLSSSGVNVASSGLIYESRDAAASWQPLPAPPSMAQTYAANARRQLFAGTPMGVFRLDAASATWQPRSSGLHAQPFSAVEPAGTGNVVLSAISPFGPPANFRSLDGGATWTSVLFGDGPAIEFVRNPNVPNSVVAVTASNAIHASSDGGAHWTPVTAYASSGPGERVAGITPAGPQPGLVYGVWQTCDGGGGDFLPAPCIWQAHGVATSGDGGATWAHASAGITAAFVSRVVVSPADPGTAMTADGIWVTRNRAAQWEQRTQAYARVVPDPVDPARWYAIDQANNISATTDAGRQWTTLAAPQLVSHEFDLLVDPHDTRRLHAVGTHGDVALSSDRGATWRIVVAPSATLVLVGGSARVGPEPVTTLYAAAAQGAIKIAIAALDAPAVLRAIEYYLPALDHYFITADPIEIAQLDGGILAGWTRTGMWFNVLAETAPGVPNVSPVCRFYGKPESGLDSHFYSASPAECQAVRDRFASDWIYESPAVFSVYLPTASDGICPTRTTPVYRLYNNRADANHRYTMWPEPRQTMIAAGWIPEGYGTYGVTMCAPW
jgi:hypothetical protein